MLYWKTNNVLSMQHQQLIITSSLRKTKEDKRKPIKQKKIQASISLADLHKQCIYFIKVKMDNSSGYVSMLAPAQNLLNEHKENFNPRTQSLQTQPIRIPKPVLRNVTNKR